MKDNLSKFYYLFLFFSLIGLVFYLGFLYGNREKVANTPNSLEIQNVNGQNLNSITQIQQRPVYGSVDSENIREFGRMYFLVNKNNQTEIVINLENIPAIIKQTKGQGQIVIPEKLRVDMARLVDNKQDYQYENISGNENNLATITLNEAKNGVRSATFSGIINSPIIDQNGAKGNIERIVLRPLDTSITNLFVDRNSDLPLKVRGNPSANIPGKPSPFFWIKF